MPAYDAMEASAFEEEFIVLPHRRVARLQSGPAMGGGFGSSSGPQAIGYDSENSGGKS